MRTMLAARRSVGGNRHASQVKVARKGGFFRPIVVAVAKFQRTQRCN